MPHQLTRQSPAQSELFEARPLAIPGAMELRPLVQEDERGRFVKTFHREVFARWGLGIDYAEDYYSLSYKGVIRGMHFQVPPMDHAKLVYCVLGEVQDVLLDLRRGSPTYGGHATLSLSAAAGAIVYIPTGVAHGFCALSETAILVYKVSQAYSPEHDRGVLWSSAGIPWAEHDPILSNRDRAHVSLSSFASPFVYQGIS
jgi:dTDP-4-dehydrorhamnose 3,5-epimerase